MIPITKCQGVDVEKKQLGGVFELFSSNNEHKLKYYQSNNQKNLKSTYYLFLRSFEIKDPIKKLQFKIVKKKKCKLNFKKLSFCTAKSKALKDVAANIEISSDNKTIDVNLEKFITGKSEDYALKFTMNNPTNYNSLIIELIAELHNGRIEKIGYYLISFS